MRAASQRSGEGGRPAGCEGYERGSALDGERGSSE